MYRRVMSDDAKDPSAVALGRKGGKKGGRARAEKLPPEKRAEIARAGARARWSRPAAIAEGELVFGDQSLPCYVLDDERRVLSQRGMIAALGMSPGGYRTGDTRIVRFVASHSLSPFITKELYEKIANPIEFRLASGRSALGYDATVLADLCEAVLESRAKGALNRQQHHIAVQCEILVRGFARVGIVALVDEATGYQYARDRKALSEILEAFVAKELAQWVKTFPDDYYAELFRLRGLRPSDDHKKPQYFGHLTNDIVYRRLAPAVLNELRRKNPKKENGRRHSAHHQWLTREIGHPKLMSHIGSVVAVMKLSPDWDTFVRNLDRVAPRYGDTLPLGIEDPVLTSSPDEDAM